MRLPGTSIDGILLGAKVQRQRFSSWQRLQGWWSDALRNVAGFCHFEVQNFQICSERNAPKMIHDIISIIPLRSMAFQSTEFGFDSDSNDPNLNFCDSRHRQCRFCGSGAYADIPCPRKTCTFSAEPSIPYYWDSTCEIGKKGRESNAIWKKTDVNFVIHGSISDSCFKMLADFSWVAGAPANEPCRMQCGWNSRGMPLLWCKAIPGCSVSTRISTSLSNWWVPRLRLNKQNFETSSNECEILTGATSHKAPDRATTGTTTVS